MIMRHTPIGCGLLIRTLALIAALNPAWMIAEEPAALENFPKAERLWLCYINGDLNPIRREEVQAQGIGKIRIMKTDDSELRRDEIFAVFRPEQMELERESLLLEQKSLARQIEDARLAHEEKMVALQAKKAEAQMSLRELTTALELREVRTDSKLKKGVEQALAASKENLDRIERRLEILDDPETLAAEVRKLEIDQRKLELDYRNALHTAELRAPFDGHLSFGPAIMEDYEGKQPPFDTWVKSGEIIGHITDSSSYEVTIDTYPAILHQTSKDELILELSAGSGEKPLTARFAGIRKPVFEGTGAKGALLFKINEEDHKRAESMAGTSANGRIYRELPEKCHIVPKADLVKLLGDRKQRPGGWDAFAQSIWPDVELVASGHLEIALRRRPQD